MRCPLKVKLFGVATTDFSGEVLFNLPLLAKSVTRNKNEFFAESYEGITTRIMVHSKMQSVLIEPGRATVMASDSKDHTNLWYLRIKARAEDGFLVTIEPHEKSEKERTDEACTDSNKMNYITSRERESLKKRKHCIFEMNIWKTYFIW